MYTVPQLADFSGPSLDAAVRDLLAALESEATAVVGETDWRAFRDRWMARKNGILSQVNDLWLKAAPGPQKRDVGQRVNQLNKSVEEAVESAKGRASGSSSSLASEKLDVTLPGIRRPLGVEHPTIRTMNTIVRVFQRMGYSVGEGPEIETDYYNFESLNFPPNHPARDTQDTIFIAGQERKAQRDRLLLRTHTSPVQIHTMERQPPPVRIVIPGKVYRHDTPDATHSPVFHQVEGLVVDTGITFCDLKGTLDHAMKALFGASMKTRFFPSFFPFTEPSADVAVTCFKCGGSGCRLCKQSGWIELLGAGMVDPNVYQFVRKNGYDPAKVSGFAFGMGVERIAMAMYGIDDIQLLYSGDVRFLEQFA
ncbi:MAG: phenylalanine--tRNA ligase subunit alpha [Candidatus Koribacter versatilis]|uniref:Phenylalanine--tRNA ligase alpha subunit n=1 Tax=Candidatus Korobacter versatilis TaxID=658062 RepID=A0A932A9T9_9BACT|nr:phenylalanine--tRNA ligase subunit alpha [Candidatus Koribacter versatilis]